jgi:hypothetical protein
VAFVDRRYRPLGKAEEIASLAVYLARMKAIYTTGTIHLIDGGFALRILRCARLTFGAAEVCWAEIDSAPAA